MKLRDIVQIVDGEVMCGHEQLDLTVEYAFASDLMSDVLTLKHCDFVLITGLCNLQSVRTAEMSDIRVIIYVRDKVVDPQMIELCEENGMTVIRTPFSMFRTVGCLYAAGLKPIY